MSGFQQFTGNAVGEEGFAYSGAAVQKKILAAGIKIAYKIHSSIIGCFAVSLAVSPVASFFIVSEYQVKRKVLKIFFFQNLCKIGLSIKKFDLCFFEAGAFACVRVACILAAGTEVMRFQIIFRKAVFFQQRTALTGQQSYGSFQIFHRAALTAEQRTCLLALREATSRSISASPGSLCKGAGASFFQVVHNLSLSPVVFSHNNIILKIL